MVTKWNRKLNFCPLRGETATEKFDIITITESWMDLNSKQLTTEFEIEGYNLFNLAEKEDEEVG